jgi:hypothetical protein
MQLSDRLTVPEHVMARQVGDETVILDLASGTYFALDPIGSRVWQLIAEDATLAQACEAMLEEFEVERPDLERDVLALVDSLIERRLVARAA